MEKLFNPCDKESMRMAMLKQEETFREQVYELHRLYQVQKILMKNTENGRQQGNSAVMLEEGNNGRTQNIVEETELELTLGLGSSKSSRRTNTDSATSLSNSSSTESSHMMRSDPGTFLITRNPSKEELIGWQWGLDHHLQSSSSRRNGASIDEEMVFRSDSHTNPPWIFQALSLNTT